MLPIRTMMFGANGSGRFRRTINLGNSAPLVNLRTVVNALGYLGDRAVDLIVNVPAGIQLDAGLYFGVFPELDHTAVFNIDGTIHGAGGVGGYADWQGQDGSAGGDAINCQFDAVINVSATGALKGGAGGGGSGGGSTRLYGPPGEEELQYIYGGEGGNGWPNWSDGPGNGGAGGSTPATDGVIGGDGSASTTGLNPWTNYYGGDGGAAGYAVRKNGHTVTVNNTGGTIIGTAS